MSIADNKMTLSAAELVLNLLEAHVEHELSVQEMTRAAALFDIQEQSLRVALSRLTRQGRVENLARGRYRLSSQGSALLADVAHWLEREERLVEWRGQWLAVSDAAVQRQYRVPWRKHRKALELRGFQTLAEGLHIRPDNLRGSAGQLHQELLALGLAPSALVMQVAALDHAAHARALKLWDVAALEARYQAMHRQLTRSREQQGEAPLGTVARESLLLGRNAVRLILHDPLLPAGMMGGATRARLVDCIRDYQQWARSVWSRYLHKLDNTDGYPMQ